MVDHTVQEHVLLLLRVITVEDQFQVVDLKVLRAKDAERKLLGHTMERAKSAGSYVTTKSETTAGAYVNCGEWVKCSTCGGSGTVQSPNRSYYGEMYCSTCGKTVNWSYTTSPYGTGTNNPPTFTHNTVKCSNCSGNGGWSSSSTCGTCHGSKTTTVSHNCSAHNSWASHYYCPTHGNFVDQLH